MELVERKIKGGYRYEIDGGGMMDDLLERNQYLTNILIDISDELYELNKIGCRAPSERDVRYALSNIYTKVMEAIGDDE